MKRQLQAVFGYMSRHKTMAAGSLAGAAVLATPLSAFADTYTTTIDYTTLFQNVANEALGAVTAVIPLAIPIFGVMLAVGLGVKVIKKLKG